jgi:predicted secreted protein
MSETTDWRLPGRNGTATRHCLLQVTVFLAVFLLAVHVKFFTVGPFQRDDVTNQRDVATLDDAANVAVGDVGSSDASVRGRLGRVLLQETVTATVADQQHNADLHSSSSE